ncbi:MAG: magnesium/cobalt transporter CorA [Chloroflexota bacterium]
MIRALYHTPDGQLRTDLQPPEFDAARREPRGVLWVDLAGAHVESYEPVLCDTFGFHPLAVDDALRETHVPKVDNWDTYLYLVLQAVTFDRRNGPQLKTSELDAFLGPNYLVTYHEQPIAVLEQVWTACTRDERHLKSGAAHLLYELTDHLVAGYMPVVDAIDEMIDAVENQIFSTPTPDTLEQLFALKRAALELRRTLSPQREVLNRLARDDYAVVETQSRVYFRDVYDHLVRLYDINEGLRDLVSGALDTYLSVINNRMNDVMRILTIITTLFMPVSFLAGFFGMNFFMPRTPLYGWNSPPVFVLLLTAMLAVPLSMYLWMRRRRWM